MAPAHMASLMKRQDDEYAIPKMAIVILCMLGAVVALVMAFAASRLFMSESTDGIRPYPVEQHEYMAEVRTRNLDILEGEARRSMYGRVKPRPKDAMGGRDTSHSFND
jgi:hypothetical protein